jgi:hypothetical protein
MATVIFHRRFHIRHQTHTWLGEGSCGRPELSSDTPGDPTDPQQKSAPTQAPFTAVNEDWTEECLAAPERTHTLETIITANRSGVVPAKQPPTVPAPKPQVLAAYADAQQVDFWAMAALQQYCPKVAEMLTSGNLQITSKTVGGGTFLMGDGSTGIFCSLVPIQMREAVFQLLHSIHHLGLRVTR